MNTQRVARNFVTTILAQLITWSLALVVTLYLPTYLGPGGLGKLGIAASVAGIAGVFVALGITNVIVKEIARDHDKLGELVTAGLLLRFPIGILAVLISVIIVKILTIAKLPGFTPDVCGLVAIYCSIAVISTMTGVLAAGLQGQEKMIRQNISGVTEKVIFSVITIMFVLWRKPLWMFAAAGLTSGAASFFINAAGYRALFPTLRLPKLETMRWLTKAGLPLMGVSIFTTLYGQTDALVLGIVAGANAAGYYKVAFQLIATTMFLPSAVNIAILPLLSRLHHQNEHEEFKRVARRAFSLLMLCGIPIGLTLMLIPAQVMDLLPFKNKFQASIPVLGVGGAGVILWFAAALMAYMVIACDQQKMLVRSSMTACFVGVPLCFAFSYLAKLYLHNAAVGAIASDVLLETLLIAMYLKILPKGILDRSMAVMIGKLIVASIPMALFLYWMINRGSGPWVVLPSALIYAIMCYALRCLNSDDFELITKVFKRNSK